MLDSLRPRALLSLGLLAALCLMPAGRHGAAGAGSLDKDPTGPVVLTVSGLIAGGGQSHQLRLDRAMLESLGTTEVNTTTPWTEQEAVFEGVLARRLMEAAGVTGTEVVCVALNDYKVVIPLSDFQAYDVLLALKMNGETLSVREKGPIWIIYPAATADHDDGDIRSRMVWQLKELVVR